MGQRRVAEVCDWSIVVVGVTMALYHLLSTQYIFGGPIEHQAIHLALALALVFLGTLRAMKRRKLWPFQTGATVFLLLGGFVAIAYIMVNFVRLDIMRGLPTTTDLIIGIILVVVVIEATRQAWGLILPGIALLTILYGFFGHLIPGVLGHSPMPYDLVVSYLGIGLDGIFGIILNASANYIFLFIVFGGLLEAVGANQFFVEIGKGAGRLLAGGPAQTAVISSSLVGMCTGAAVANVALTGAFTIPLMKKTGYDPETAGAIEATASTGGQIMPPVMGASGFVMAGITGIAYVNIMLAAIIPAVLYFLAVALGVQILATKLKIRPPREKIEIPMLLARGPLFVIPLGVIVVLLLLRFSPMYAAFWAIITVVLLSMFQKGTRPSASTLAKGFAKGAMVGAKIALACACIGILARLLVVTGLGIKAAGIVKLLSGDHLILALIITMFLSILLGTGIPTVAAYTLVAIVVAPVLVNMGVGLLEAHFFAFYFAIISALTPPVAMAALAGSSIAGGNYFKTSFTAFKLGIAGFILPYLIVFNPILILRPLDPLWGALSLVAISIGLLALVIIIYGYFLTKLTPLEMVISILVVGGLFGYCFIKSYIFLGAGILLFIALLVSQIRKRKALRELETMNHPSGR